MYMCTLYVCVCYIYITDLKIIFFIIVKTSSFDHLLDCLYRNYFYYIVRLIALPQQNEQHKEHIERIEALLKDRLILFGTYF